MNERGLTKTPQEHLRMPSVGRMFADPTMVRGSNVAMAKNAVLKKDLELIALQEIRSFPGGEHVISVEVEFDAGDDRELNWRLHVIAKDEAEFERIHYAAKTTTERLKRRYCLKR